MKNSAGFHYLGLAVLTLCGLFLFGCSSNSPRHTRYPDYYRNWIQVPQNIRVDLELARKEIEKVQRPEAKQLLRYARSSALLASFESNRWLDLCKQSSNKSSTSGRSGLVRARSRLLQACTHGIALYRQAELKGSILESNDSIKLAKMLVFRGEDIAAQSIISDLLRLEAFTPGQIQTLDSILGELMSGDLP